MSDLVTIAIVDDELEVRDAFRTILGKRPEFKVIGEAADGAAGLALWRDLHPDVTLMDLKMPIMSGIEAIRAICAEDPAACVVALTTFGTPDYIVGAIKAGASGYLLKDSRPADLATAIHQAHAGEMPISQGVLLAVVNSIHDDDLDLPHTTNIVSQREAELLQWLAQGLSNQQIAERMYLSEGTVKQYLNRISDKLGVRARTQIVVRALQLGIVNLDSLPTTLEV